MDLGPSIGWTIVLKKWFYLWKKFSVIYLRQMEKNYTKKIYILITSLSFWVCPKLLLLSSLAAFMDSLLNRRPLRKNDLKFTCTLSNCQSVWCTFAIGIGIEELTKKEIKTNSLCNLLYTKASSLKWIWVVFRNDCWICYSVFSSLFLFLQLCEISYHIWCFLISYVLQISRKRAFSHWFSNIP